MDVIQRKYKKNTNSKIPHETYNQMKKTVKRHLKAGLTCTIWSLTWICPFLSAALPMLIDLTKMPDSSSAGREREQGSEGRLA